jgi:gliding motility-associated-like protein
MKFFVHRIIFTALFFLPALITPLLAQNYQRHNWYFGDSPQAIQFNISDNQPQLATNQNTTLGYGAGGPLTVTDNNSGELLFYTDGNNVFNRLHQLMTNGNALNGNSNLNQAVAGAPVPGSDGQYYIFTKSGGNLLYHVVDINLQGGAPADAPALGAVSQKNQATGITNINEAMLALETGANPYRYWLLLQDNTSGDINLYEIGAGGVFTLTSTFTPPAPTTAGNFAFHRPSGTLAISPSNQATNVQLYDFDPATTTFTFNREILNTGNNDDLNQSIFDVEFSLSGDIMYISRFGGTTQPGVLYHVDLSLATPSVDQVNPGTLFRSYGLQIAPDSSIYHLYQPTSGGPIRLARINEPDSALALIEYELNPLGMLDFNGRQFPSFSPRVLPELGCEFEVIGNCLNNPVQFIPTWTDQPDLYSYRWNLGDTTSNFHSPIYTYANQGIYDISLTISYNGIDTTCTIPWAIVQSDTVDLGQDTVICPGETLTLDAGPNGLSYTWNVQGETGQTIDVDSAGTYWVVVEYSSGCSSYDAINIEVYGEQMQFANVWYFGEQAGIDFNEQPPLALNDGQTQAPAGVATISDANGDLIFYTDGDAVYNRDHTIIDTGIGGQPNSSQSVIIVPVPEDETLFYIFTTEDIYTPSHGYVLRYSIFDLKIPGGGGIIPESKASPLYYQTTERLAALGGGAGSWLLSHELGTNTFRAYGITERGISQPVLSSVGSIHNEIPRQNGEGYMRFSPDGSRVAVAFSGPNNYVEIFDFDNTTGELSNPLQIEFPESFPEYTVYGVQFTGGGEKLYVTLKPGTGNESVLYEVNLYEYDKAFIESNLPAWEIERTPGAEFGALQTGPDGQVYMAVDNEGFLGRFSPQADSATLAFYDFDNSRFDLNGGVSRLGLPNFIQNMSQQSGGPALSATGVCLGQPTVFVGTPTSVIDEIFWTFGDGASDMGENVFHTYGAAGLYTVTMDVVNRCDFDTTLTQDITIVEPVQPTLAGVTPICTLPLVLDADTTNTQPVSYLWNTGDTTKTIEVTAPQTITVDISTPEGCTDSDTTIVVDARPQFDLGPNQIVCQDEAVPDLNTGLVASGYIHTWTVNGANTGNTSRLQSVNTSVPGTFLYRVEVFDNLTGCIAEDSIRITVNPLPTATTMETFVTNCGDSNGAIEITSDLTGLSFEWFDNGGTSLGNSNPLTGLASGIYQLQLTDNVTGCINTIPIEIIDLIPPLANLTIDNVIPNCDDNAIVEFTIAPVNPTQLVEYIFTNTEDNSQISGDSIIQNPNTSVSFSVGGFSAGTNYSVFYSVDGCSDNGSVNVPPSDPTADLSIDPAYDFCLNDPALEITASSSTGGATFSWTVPGGGNPTGATIPVTQNGDHTVTVSAADFCDTTATTVVTRDVVPDVDIDLATDGCDGTRDLVAVVAMTTPSGNYSYLWNTGEIGPSITINQSRTFDVQVRSQVSGCLAYDTIVAEVYEPFFVSLGVDPVPCDDGEPVTILADVFDFDGNQLPAGNYNYAWYKNEVLLQRDTTESVISLDEGSFRVEVTTAQCRADGSLNFMRAPLTESNVEPRYLFCPEPPVSEVVTIEPGNFDTYSLTNLDNGAVIPETDPGVFEITEQGNYAFELVNIYGCVTYDTTFVEERCVPTIVVPNAFRPTSSLPTNQTFKVLPLYIDPNTFEIFIYNRWGEIIFYSNNLNFMQNEGWNGISEGKELPSGTYAYIMKYKSSTEPELGLLEQSGGVTLIR